MADIASARTLAYCLMFLMLAPVIPGLPAYGDDSEQPDAKRAVGTAEARMVEVVFTDEGNMRVVLEVDTLELETPYGKLTIPVEEVRRILPATRLDEKLEEQINKAILNLASADFAVRESASKELAELQVKAYLPLVKACKHSDPEVARHARELVAKLKSNVPAERLDMREFDVIETPHSTISGKLLLKSLPVKTAQFGKQNLQLAAVRSLRSVLVEAEEKEDGSPVEADPGSLTGLREAIGKKFLFRVTGRIDGSVYGTGIYTTDSTLATAAVHCGALKVGETAVLRVSVVPSPPAFMATAQNGVTSYAWGPYPAAYQIQKLKRK